MNDIKYIQEVDFKKLTKKQKIQLPECSGYLEAEITKLVLIPTNTKTGGFCLGHFFAHTDGKGWWKATVYDCWNITTEIDNPAKLRYGILKGDFEHGGINIFSFADQFHKAYISYGGSIVIKKK